MKSILKAWPAAILLFILSTAFYDVVFFGRTFKVGTANSQALPTGVYGQEHNKPRFIPVNGTDSPVLEEPLYAFIRREVLRGRLPLWNPHQAAGYPLIGLIQVGLFYPLNLLWLILPPMHAWDVLILLRLLLAGIFTYSFSRAVGLSRIAALTAGVAFMLSGPMVLLQYWTANVDILLPLLLTAILRLVQDPSPRRTGLLAVVVGLTILAGHPEHILLVNAYGSAFLIFLLRRRGAPVGKAAGGYLAALALGAGLAAAALIPFLRNLTTEFWHGHPPGAGLLMEEQRGRAITLVLPHFFQKAPVSYQWVFAGWWGGYLGCLPLMLAASALWGNRLGLRPHFFAAATGIILAKEYGLPFVNWIGRLPLLDLPRYAIHSPPLVAFSVAMLAGMGVDTMDSLNRRSLKGLIFSLPLLLVVGVSLWIHRNADFFPQAVRASLFAGGLALLWHLLTLLADRRRICVPLLQALLLAAVCGELILHIHRERPRRFDSFPPVPYIEHLKTASRPVRAYGLFWAFYPNTATGYGVDDLGVFCGLVPRRFVHFVNRLLLPGHFRNDMRPPALRAMPILGRDDLLDLLNVRYLIAPADDRFSRLFPRFRHATDGLPLVYRGEVRVYERPRALPRAFVVHRVLFAPDENEAYDFMERNPSRLRRLAVLQAPPDEDITAALAAAPEEDASRARVLASEPNRLSVAVRMNHPGILVLSEAYHPDWKVFVDGRPDRLFLADGFLRAVFLPAGRHTVRFVFRPVGFFLGLAVSSGAALLIGLLLFHGKPKTP